MIKSALTVLAVAGSGVLAQADPPSAPVATVDGQAIEQQHFDHWLQVAGRSSLGTVPDPATGYRRCIATKRKAAGNKQVTDAQLRRQCEQDYAQLRDQVMQLLISFKWIEGEAAVRGVTVTEAEAAAELDEQRRQSFPSDADFQEFLETSGQTLEDILQRVRLDLLSNKIREHVVVGHEQVSEQDVERFYRKHKDRFAEPEKRAVRIVLTKREAEARRARAALERGGTWKAVARRYSIDSGTKRRGGALPAQPKGALDRPLDTAVFRARKGRLVGPVRTRYGYYVFTVTKVRPARQAPLAEVAQAIKETLVSERQQAALDTFVRDFTARWRAKTECAEGYRTSDCRNGPPAPTSGARRG